MTLTWALERLLEGHDIFSFTQNTITPTILSPLLQTRKCAFPFISLVFQCFQNYHILVAETGWVIFHLISFEPCEYKYQCCFINSHFLSYSLWISAIEEYQVWSVLLKSFRQHPANTHAERPRELSLHNTFSLELPPFFHAYVFLPAKIPPKLSIKLLVGKK